MKITREKTGGPRRIVDLMPPSEAEPYSASCVGVDQDNELTVSFGARANDGYTYRVILRGEELARILSLAAGIEGGCNVLRQALVEDGDGLALIAAERRRQVEVEGWTPEHDDAHDTGELADAAACYAAARIAGQKPSSRWPWSLDWWKPSPDNRVRDLVKAGALLVAEIDRLRRREG